MNALLNISGKNIFPFGSFEDWVNGTSSAPTAHILFGAGASVARDSSIVKRGTYSAKITRSGAKCGLEYLLPTADFSNLIGKTITMGAWVYCNNANSAYLTVQDSVGTASSVAHSGNSAYSFLTVTFNVDPFATNIQCYFIVDGVDGSAYFDGAILVEGSNAFTDLSPYLEEWKPSKKYRMSKFVVARRPGFISPFNEHDSKTISVSGVIYGTDPTSARTTFDSVMQSLNESEKDLYLYDDRFLRVFIESQDESYIAALRGIPFTISFFAQNPFYNSAQKYRTEQVVSAPPGSFTVTTNGNAYTKPVITITASAGDVTSCIIKNLTTGQLFSFNGTILSGNSLVIDFDAVTILNNGVDATQYIVGDYPQFRLNAGANIIRYDGNQYTIDIDRYDRWL